MHMLPYELFIYCISVITKRNNLKKKRGLDKDI